MKMQSNKGFTLIEMVVVILLTAIMSAVAIPQFIDYRTEAKNAKTQAILGAIRTGINNQYAQQLMRCNAQSGDWPKVAAVQANDIEEPGVGVYGTDYYCETGAIPIGGEKAFITGHTPGTTIADGLPNNPWAVTANLPFVGAPAVLGEGINSVTACALGGCTRCAVLGCDGASQMDGGWCYNEATGDFWADSASNRGTPGTDSECDY